MEPDINAAIAALKDLINMADVLVTIKIMPSGIDVDLDKLKTKAVKEIMVFKARVVREEIEPIAFGIKALKITFAYEESRGGTDAIEEKIVKIAGVESVDVVDVRRAIG